MKNFKDIDQKSKEGMLLTMAIACITTSEKVTLNGRTFTGTTLSADDVVDQLDRLAVSTYPEYGKCNLGKEEPPKSFLQLLEQLINTFSMEKESDTPDFILAQYLFDCLEVFNKTVMRRDDWKNPDVKMKSGYAENKIQVHEGCKRLFPGPGFHP